MNDYYISAARCNVIFCYQLNAIIQQWNASFAFDRRHGQDKIKQFQFEKLFRCLNSSCSISTNGNHLSSDISHFYSAKPITMPCVIGTHNPAHFHQNGAINLEWFTLRTERHELTKNRIALVTRPDGRWGKQDRDTRACFCVPATRTEYIMNGKSTFLTTITMTTTET